MIDIKKIIHEVNDWPDAVDALTKTEQHLLEALNIMQSVVDNPSEDFKELHEKRIKKFISQFQ